MDKYDFIFYKCYLEEENLKVYTDYKELSSDIFKFFKIEISEEELIKLDNEEY